ncbi:hypothetical protein N7414_30215 [Pseudomonas sp. GD04087]|uniref:hypothetical protein n=1 Tax=unclassified Pseudomonas TaxID=196821 RepID=UPI0024484A9D|nr:MULTISPECIES: hypothetical protein [unclassified Pseudomonas]MDH0293415.1 hypothetical protein [Pseudomonas sp. GD04087]MDH1053000.1 hypothetical protein [Pseudomonas sp. GD03903]MDH2003143.1 hypothetical protein [Pseudomonas sp. GD03691]
MSLHHRLRRYWLTIPLLGLLPLAHADTHESLSAAVESLWSSEQTSTRVLGSSFTRQVSKAGSEYRTEAKDAPSYLETAGESAWLVMGKQRFDAVATPWGKFPRLDLRDGRLLEINLPDRRYQVIASSGAGLFGVGDWRRYGFLHVIDVSTPSAPTYYPLYADANLGEHALGRLPGSAVLNYARLVPASRNKAGEIEAYEVSLYALGRKGPERLFREGAPLAYQLKQEGDGWVIDSVGRTPVTNERDEEHRSFTTPLRPPLFLVRENAKE